MKFEGLRDEDIVISGIGFKLPGCDNLQEFTQKLFDGINLVTDDPKKNSVSSENVPNFNGKVKAIENFDNMFFSISNLVAKSMDPITKHILERTLEAIIDAGLNPADLKKTETSVYVGTSHSDFDLVWSHTGKDGYVIMGKNRCMNANRVSWWLDINGSSVAMDASCTNGIMNIVHGWEAIRNGRCDTAIVSTCSLQTLPENQMQFNDYKTFSPDGNCKAYDDSANGWCRSDAVVVFVLQRATAAKRCYAVIDDAFCTFYGEGLGAINIPSQEHWEHMFEEFYAKSKININEIFYLEGQGAAVKEEDASELNAINSVFCKNRSTPLLLGSVKSNIGNTEAASASCSILKAIVSFEKGIIPKNLHYNTPNTKCKGLIDGKIKVVADHAPIPPNALIAINAQGISNLYAHLVLRANPKTKRANYDGIPRLILLSARTDSAIDHLLDKIESSPLDVEQVGLLHEVFTRKIDRYLSRGYTIIPKINEESIREHQVFDPIKRPVWFIFSGMGSQWCQMGKRLMDLLLFRESIEKCHKILEKKNLNLIDIISSDDPKIFDNILNAFVGIAAIQIALVDILNVLGIVPDKMIGHSVGELGCSYADGCLTAEQTILCAFSRGKASIETPLVKGFMAAIGKGYKEIKDELPEGIEVACHNAADSCTISGPAELVQNYVKELQERKVFARTVNVANIAYHSNYITPAAPKLLEYLKQVIPQPKKRSEKWVSTSILEENWNTDLAKYCSAEYHTNNLLSSVFFEEGSKAIPKDAICIEIAPHGLLQAILKRSLHKGCLNIPLTSRVAKDPLTFLFQAIGKMYIGGLEPQVKNLYPKIEYPVSRGTSPLHNLITWEHSIQTAIDLHSYYEKKFRYFLKEQFSRTSKDETGYLVKGKNYYPLSVFLDLTWGAFASIKKIRKEECPVLFEDVRVEKQMVIPDSELDTAIINIGAGTGKFEIYTDEIVIRGVISLVEDIDEETFQEIKNNDLNLNNEIYMDFERRGYNIGSDFKCLKSVEIDKNVWKGRIDLSSDWLQTIESMIQLNILERGKNSRSLVLPSSVERLSIIPQLHSDYKPFGTEVNSMELTFCTITNTIKCGGITIKGLQLQPLKTETASLKFESKKFVPFENSLQWDLWEIVDYCCDIISDNHHKAEMSINQITNGIRVPAIASYLEKKFSPCNVTVSNYTKNNDSLKKFDLVICDELSLPDAVPLLDKRGFIFVKLSGRKPTIPQDMNVISTFFTYNDVFALLNQKEMLNHDAKYITMPNNEISLTNIIKEPNEEEEIIYLIDYESPNPGFETLKKKIHKETKAHLRWVLILDKKAPKFNPKNSFYSEQLKKGLVTNIYCNGSWGSYYNRTFKEKNLDLNTDLINKNKELNISFVGINLEENLIHRQKVVEYSGTLADNTKVTGIAEIKENKRMLTDKQLQWKLPKTWTLQEGATIPISYSLAYYCLNIKGLWNRHKIVLVTDGLSYNGQAAIPVALSLGFRVYVTVNNDEEIPILKQNFPALNESDIVIHEDNDFDAKLGLITKGENFDIILNNVENERLNAALNCLAFGGTLFHFGKEDIKKNMNIGMNIFLSSVGFYGISPDLLGRLSLEEKKDIRNYIAGALEKGHIKPLPVSIYNSKDNQKIKKENEISENRSKILLSNDNCKQDSDRLQIDPENSYIIIGDDSDFWIDIAEWLGTKNINNIVVRCGDTSEDSWGRAKTLTNADKILVQKKMDIRNLLTSAGKLGPIGAVFFISMNGVQNGLKTFTELDKFYRDKNCHLIAISKENDLLSQKCSERMAREYPSTNFDWNTEERLTVENLTMIEKLSGQDSFIQVSDSNKIVNKENPSCILADILPSSIDEFSELGSSLSNEYCFTELPTLSLRNGETKEITPLFVIPGLKSNYEHRLMQLTKNLMCPVILIKLPFKSKECTIEELASIILPKIQALNNSKKAYNILAISWGSYVAIELTRLIEELGGNVNLLLIDGPLKTLKETLLAKKSLEHDLLNFIKGMSKNGTSDVSSSDLCSSQMDRINKSVGLSAGNKKEVHVKNAAAFIYQNLKAMLAYNYSETKFKGPITILKSEAWLGDTSIKKNCNNVSIGKMSFDLNDNLIPKDLINLINNSMITPGMNEDFINLCSWKGFAEFLVNDKLESIKNKTFLADMIKAGREICFSK